MLLAYLTVLTLTASCGTPPATLSAGDVTNLPAGTGTGSVVSGRYTVTKAAIDDCACRAGECSTLNAQPTGHFQAVQQNGALTLNVDDGNGNSGAMTGGVNADLSFKVGSAVMNTTNGFAHVTHAWTLIIGAFALNNGRPASLHAEESGTVLSQILGRTYDCDLRVTVDADFTGP